MRQICSIVATLAWALWLGGMIALFLFVKTLFAGDRAIAVEAAPRLFLVFQKYQLVLAAIGLIATLGWRVVIPSKLITAIFVLLAIATLAGVVVGTGYVGPMEQLRLAGESSSPQFKKLHGQSMGLYVGETVLLTAAGLLIPSAMRIRPTQTSRQTAAETVPPA